MADTAPAAVPAAIPAPAADPKAAPVPVAEATETIKVNGKEVKVTKAQLLAYAQKGMFADQKLKGMDVLQSKSAALVESLKTPEGIIKAITDPALGASPILKKQLFEKLMESDSIDDDLKEKMSAWVYKNVVQKAKLTPEQIENDKKLSDYERLKKQEEERKKADVTKQQQEQINQVYQAVRAEVTKQIVADKTFPQTEGAIRSVVEKLRVMNKKGAPITPENIGKALGLVKKDHVLHQQTMFDALTDPEQLIALVGEARALKISKALIDRLKKKMAAKVEAKPEEGAVREKVTDRIDRKLGRTAQGYHVLDI